LLKRIEFLLIFRFAGGFAARAPRPPLFCYGGPKGLLVCLSGGLPVGGAFRARGGGKTRRLIFANIAKLKPTAGSTRAKAAALEFVSAGPPLGPRFVHNFAP
jgi:hypothetical protein